MANRGRPRRDLSYQSKLVKKANERLRKLESVHKEMYSLKGIQFDFAQLSRAYRDIKKYAEGTWGKNKPQIYRIDEETGAIRFLTKSQYNELTDEGKKYYIDMLNQFLENQTSTKMGVEQAYIDAYNTFRKNNPQFTNMTFQDYMEAWKVYNDNVKADESNHFGYGKIIKLIKNGKFSAESIEALTAGQVEKANHYMSNVTASTTNGVGGKYMTSHTPIRNTSMKGVKYRGISGSGA